MLISFTMGILTGSWYKWDDPQEFWPWDEIGMGQNPGSEPQVIAGKWMFIPRKMVLIGIDP